MALRHRFRLTLLAGALSALAAGAFADSFTTTGADFSKNLRGNRAEVVHAGGTAWVTGRAMTEGQMLRFRRGETLLADEPLVVGADGSFSFAFDLPADAAVGQHPITVTAQNPDGAGVMMLKVSPRVALQGQDGFDIAQTALAKGIYQVAAGRDDKLFVAASSGRGDEFTSVLMRLDGKTLTPDAEITPPRDDEGVQIGVYGLAVDNSNGTVWATNTRQDTVTIYRQDDLSVVKTFPIGTVAHPRDVIIDEAAGRAYVNAALTPVVHVFDTATTEEIGTLSLPATNPREPFASMDLKLANGRIYSTSRATNEVAWVDVASGTGTAFRLDGLLSASGVAVDPASNRLFVVGQDSDNLMVVNGDDGTVLADTPIGAGALNVQFDPQAKRVYAISRGAATLTVLDTDGQITANLPAGKLGNHLILDGAGGVYAVSMSSAEEDARGSIFHVTPR